MAWIKRNLFFLIGSIIAAAMLGGAGFYLFSKNKLNNGITAKLVAIYAELDQLNTKKPSAGNNSVDNTKAAREQNQEVRDLIAKGGKFFERVPPIPDSTNITDGDFAAQLRDTIEQLQQEAAKASVNLPPRYDFSFSTIKSKIMFAPGSLQPWSVQLGEIKALCGVLFDAKINFLDSLRRERVSPDDREVADYLELKSVTTDLAVMTPYEITFRCFSGDLAAVLRGFASSKHCFIVKSVNVEPGGAAAGEGYTPQAAPAPYTPAPAPVPGRRLNTENEDYFFDPLPAGTPAATVRGGLPTVLNERPLKVTMSLTLVKLNQPSQ